MPDEERELHEIEISWTTPFSREGMNGEPGQPMTYDEYKPLQIYVNDELYPYALPAILESDTPITERTAHIYSFDEYMRVEITLKDLQDRESLMVPIGIYDFTVPTAPVFTCPSYQ